MGHWTVFAVGIYAVVMALVFAASGFTSPPGSAAVPVSLAFTTVGLLSTAAGYALRRQGQRIAALERELAERRGAA